MSEETPKKKPAAKKAQPRKAAAEKAPAKRGRPPKKAAEKKAVAAEKPDPKPAGQLVTANDVQRPSLRKRMLLWFKRKS